MRGTKRIGGRRRPKRSGTKKSTRGARGRVAPPKKTARRGRKGAKRPRSTRRRRRHQRGGEANSPVNNTPKEIRLLDTIAENDMRNGPNEPANY